MIEGAPPYGCWRATHLLLEAWLAHRAGEAERATATLREALGLARLGTQHYYMRFPDRALVPMFRLALVQGVGVVLRNGLDLMGVSAPDQM